MKQREREKKKNEKRFKRENSLSDLSLIVHEKFDYVLLK